MRRTCRHDLRRYRLKALDGDFDLIFVDANKDGYAGYVQTILDRKLLSPQGVILCDNVFARGLSVGEDCAPWLNDHVRPYWASCGKALDSFNRTLAEDPRVDVIVIPVFDGMTYIKWKTQSATNGVAH
jgi:predicted O-methyltransferase YrrM